MSNKQKKIIYITGSRSDYGLMRHTLESLNRVSRLELIVVGMHLDKKYGFTINEINKDQFKIIAKIKYPKNQSTATNMISNFSFLLSRVSQLLAKHSPDLVIVEGDRYDTLALALAAKNLGITVFHQGGGDISGTIDDDIRRAITAFSDFHFAGNIFSAQRLNQSGINRNKIYMFGEPGLDDIANHNFSSPSLILEKFRIKPGEKVILYLQHPDLKSRLKPIDQIRPVLQAIREVGVKTIIIYPNNDAGSDQFIKEINRYKKLKNFSVYKSVPRDDFLGLLNVVSLIVGNSSSGLIETTLFNLPFINIGDRQKNRDGDTNVISSDYNRTNIIRLIKKNLEKKGSFNLKYIYGRGRFTTQFVDFFQSKILN
ncbi:MAG: UDP-N-acetylglucosamine 2-epimerase [Candidatus Buchananbacteria bacterium]